MSAAFDISTPITSGVRSITGGKEFNHLFPIPDHRDRIIIKDGNVGDTVELMKKVVHKYLGDTANIAPHLREKTLEDTCRKIWHFIYHHLQYKLDEKGLEQLRRPARSWAERNTGVDCDCMSIMTSSILTNLQIEHSFRITKYDEDYWQHVYVIIPFQRGKYFTIDAVVSRFNYEKQFSEKKDFAMSLKGINVAVLSGVGNDLENAVMATSFDELAGTSPSPASELERLKQHLMSTRRSISTNPGLISSIEDPRAMVKMLDYAIHHWNTDKRDHALAILERNEDQLNMRNGFSGMEDDMFDYDQFVLSGPGKRGFFKNIRKAAKEVGAGIKKAVKGVIRFNPVTIAARGGFLVAMKLNLGKMASRLKWAYSSKQEAMSKGISESNWNKSKEALSKIESLFSGKLQGKPSALKDAILKGKGGNLNGVVESGFGQLGAVTAATIAAAAPIIIAAVEIMKKSGLVGADEDLDGESLANEMANNKDADKALDETGDDEDTGAGDNEKKAPKGNDGSGDPKGNGVMDFIKANPVPVVIGGSILAFGLYRLLSSDKKKPVNEAAKTGGNKTLNGAGKRSCQISPHAKKLPLKTVKLL